MPNKKFVITVSEERHKKLKTIASAQGLCLSDYAETLLSIKLPSTYRFEIEFAVKDALQRDALDWQSTDTSHFIHHLRKVKVTDDRALKELNFCAYVEQREISEQKAADTLHDYVAHRVLYARRNLRSTLGQMLLRGKGDGYIGRVRNVHVDTVVLYETRAALAVEEAMELSFAHEYAGQVTHNFEADRGGNCVTGEIRLNSDVSTKVTPGDYVFMRAFRDPQGVKCHAPKGIRSFPIREATYSDELVHGFSKMHGEHALAVASARTAGCLFYSGIKTCQEIYMPDDEVMLLDMSKWSLEHCFDMFIMHSDPLTGEILVDLGEDRGNKHLINAFCYVELECSDPTTSMILRP